MTQAGYVANADLATADLQVDATYQGGRAGNSGDDPLAPLLKVSNQGGFRHLGRREKPNLLAITTTMAEPDWPDWLDLQTGIFTYFGDNRKPGQALHDTPRWGNEFLRDMFRALHARPAMREQVCPVLVFRKTGEFRDVTFLGLAVPGGQALSETDDLVAVWRDARGERFQNYRALFTILDVPNVSRGWLEDIQRGEPMTEHAPPAWLQWRQTGRYLPLRSRSVLAHRVREEQLPAEGSADWKMLYAIYETFREHPHAFEHCAAAIAQALLPNIVTIDVTRPSRDGGRDAVGQYRIGTERISVEVQFALEAKCYEPDHSVGVRETSRLISRLRHRQFGVLVTTSFVSAQAYEELVEDSHPVIVVSGGDIVDIMKRDGKRDLDSVRHWAESFLAPSLPRTD